MKAEISRLSSWSYMVALAAMGILAACGDTVENVNQINQMGMAVVDSAKDLPKCTDENEGEQVFVKDAGTTLICVDGDWVATNSGSSGNPDFSCKTEELKDKSGLKIVCNGDSIGVVLNGADGKQGEAGKDGDAGTGCEITDRNDTAVVVKCGESMMTIDLNIGLPNDTAEADSEKVAISLDSLAGYTQKGPFLKGSTVYLYELSDGRTLKQTNGNFTSKITRDDGRYKFTARDLVSQYAMLVVDGFYRNEVTGQKSDASLRLTALTDMRKRSSANVNLLTHLEFDRVYHLVTRGDSTGKKLTVKQAKRQAQKEILKQFHIELDSNTDAEDMDVFGSSDADAALLAVSILLQGDSGTTDLSVLMTEISNDIAEYGKWKNDSAKAAFADWALAVDGSGKFATFSSNVTNWGLGKAPDFAKFVRRYASIEDSLGVCGVDEKVGTVKNVTNANSKKYYAASYTAQNNKTRFICIDSTGVGKMWRVATDLEKDFYMSGKSDGGEDGEFWTGYVTGKTYKYDEHLNVWKNIDALDTALRSICTYKHISDRIKANDVWYYCSANGWVSLMGWNWSVPKEARLNPEIEYDTYKDPRDEKVYKIVTIAPEGSEYSATWLAENLNYADSSKTPSLKGRSWCYSNVAKNCDVGGRLYTWAAAIDSVKLATDADNPQDCGYGKTCTLPAKVQGICPTGWHLPSKSEWEALFTAVGGQSKAGKILKSQTGWNRNGNGTDGFGFAAIPAGLRDYKGDFNSEGNYARFWSSTEYKSEAAYIVNLFYPDENAPLGGGNKDYGISVRCVKD